MEFNCQAEVKPAPLNALGCCQDGNIEGEVFDLVYVTTEGTRKYILSNIFACYMIFLWAKRPFGSSLVLATIFALMGRGAFIDS